MAVAPAILTHSRLKAYRTCARLHHLRYVEGWVPNKDAEALRFGTLFHLGMEGWWGASDPAFRLDNALALVAGKGVDPFEQVKLEEVLRGYDAAWGADDEYEVVGIEEAFDCDLLNPETWKPSRTWRLNGKIDLLLRRKSDGAILVGEHKTTSEPFEDPVASYWLRLQMDHQISAYVVGAEALGHKVSEIFYDVAQRPALRPYLATPQESRKYTKDGFLYKTQHENDETPEEYRERVRAHIAENPSRYFGRRVIPRLESQIRDFLMDAWQQASMMREGERLGIAPRNPDACNRFGICPFFSSVCSVGGHPSEHPTEFKQVEDVNPELSAPPKEV